MLVILNTTSFVCFLHKSFNCREADNVIQKERFWALSKLYTVRNRSQQAITDNIMNISFGWATSPLCKKAEEIKMKPMKMSLCCKLCAKREYFSNHTNAIKILYCSPSKRFLYALAVYLSCSRIFFPPPSPFLPPSIVVYKIQ